MLSCKLKTQGGDGVLQVRTFPCNITGKGESIMWAIGERKDKPKSTKLPGKKMITSLAVGR